MPFMINYKFTVVVIMIIKHLVELNFAINLFTNMDFISKDFNLFNISIIIIIIILAIIIAIIQIMEAILMIFNIHFQFDM